MWKELKKFVTELLADLKGWFYDVLLSVLGFFLDGLASVIELIELPDFIATSSINNYFPDSILYFLAMSNFGGALALVGGAYLFRIARRFLTLGIW